MLLRRHEVVRVIPKHNGHLQLIRDLEDNYGVDRWSEVLRPHQEVRMSLSQDKTNETKQLLKSNNMDFTIMSDDVEKLIKKSNDISKAYSTQRSKRDINAPHYSRYLRYHEIIEFLNEQNSRTNITSLISIGKSSENRSIIAIKIGQKSAHRNILMDCGIHAREFISPSTCIYMIEKFIGDAILLGNNSLLSIFNIYMIPLLNPDGYEYAQTERRMWRKNRSPNIESHYNCKGVDLNRNFGYHWMENGASQNPCSETYAGPYADSEPETQGLENFIRTKSWHAYLTFHSYGQYWIYPWGFARRVPFDHQELVNKLNISIEIKLN
ncbi:unnamed protein product [Didymodactylos carnosus]|uniref:Peptidase M14 domain-containing protein n=1 Tax=Didymodactylos carnosus TaxID=1234261 RepID=A0A815G038_9BILA|nr:unnamed protein product [Didymodactylos carnosus]CAF1332178.1 unnamed protein product [Didymodactylos carnosus]CAF3580590.1 unnamed protein product [Didymodactylos carnosus]CAF4186698.1 unnamed protein product [Didymodactylos carnosus]